MPSPAIESPTAPTGLNLAYENGDPSTMGSYASQGTRQNVIWQTALAHNYATFVTSTAAGNSIFRQAAAECHTAAFNKSQFRAAGTVTAAAKELPGALELGHLCKGRSASQIARLP